MCACVRVCVCVHVLDCAFGNFENVETVYKAELFWLVTTITRMQFSKALELLVNYDYNTIIIKC